MRRTILFMSVATAIALALWSPGNNFDFVYDWMMARAFVEGVDPYIPLDQLAADFGLRSNLDLIHPRTPGALLVMAPIGFVPWEWEYIVGRLLTVTSAFAYAIVLAKLARKDMFWFVALVPVVMLIWPVSDTLDASQSVFFVGALIGLSWLIGDRWIAGLPLAVAVTFKLWPWLLVPGLWLSGRRRAAVGTGVAFIGLNLIGLMFPHITFDGVDRMLGDANVWLSWSPWTISPPILAGIGLAALIVVSRVAHPFRWAIPIGLAVAPTFFPQYLSALFVSGAMSGVRDSGEFAVRPEGGDTLPGRVLSL